MSYLLVPSHGEFISPFMCVAPLFGSTRLASLNQFWDALIPLYHFIETLPILSHWAANRSDTSIRLFAVLLI